MYLHEILGSTFFGNLLLSSTHYYGLNSHGNHRLISKIPQSAHLEQQLRDVKDLTAVCLKTNTQRQSLDPRSIVQAQGSLQCMTCCY